MSEMPIDILKLQQEINHLRAKDEHNQLLLRMYKTRCEHIAHLATIDLTWISPDAEGDE